MKKTVTVLLLMLMLCSLIPFGEASAARPPPLPENTFVFPTALTEIEEEAFAGTAAKTAVFGKQLVRIGDGAFSCASLLTDIYIPASVIHIGEHPFPQNESLRIHGEKHSYAETWAKEHQLPFIPCNIWTIAHIDGQIQNGEKLQAAGIHPHRSEKEYRLHARTADEGKSMRPQERPELNPIDYKFP